MKAKEKTVLHMGFWRRLDKFTDNKLTEWGIGVGMGAPDSPTPIPDPMPEDVARVVARSGMVTRVRLGEYICTDYEHHQRIFRSSVHLLPDDVYNWEFIKPNYWDPVSADDLKHLSPLKAKKPKRGRAKKEKGEEVLKVLSDNQTKYLAKLEDKRARLKLKGK